MVRWRQGGGGLLVVEVLLAQVVLRVRVVVEVERCVEVLVLVLAVHNSWILDLMVEVVLVSDDWRL